MKEGWVEGPAFAGPLQVGHGITAPKRPLQLFGYIAAILGHHHLQLSTRTLARGCIVLPAHRLFKETISYTLTIDV